MHNFIKNILGMVTSSGTDLEEPSCAISFIMYLIKEQTWRKKTFCMISSQNIPDSVKSSGTVLEEPLCTILSLNILDTVKSSRTDLKCAILFRVYQIKEKVAEQIWRNNHAHFYHKIF